MKNSVRKEELMLVRVRFTIKIFILIIAWFAFKDMIDAPTWACWAVVVNLYFILSNTEWLMLLEKER